jgi:hypothetical protein
MKSRLIPLACLIILVAGLSLFVYAQDKDRTAVSLGAQIRSIFGGYTCNIFCFVAFSVAGVACIVIIFSGFNYLTSQDPEERDQVKKKIIYVLVGLILFVAMVPVVNFLTGLGSANLSPFGCNCLNNSIDMTEPPVIGTTLPGLNVIIVKPNPKYGDLDMDKLIEFVCVGYGGIKPYGFRWTSNKDGDIGFADSFMNNLSRGNHTITVVLTDSIGNVSSAQVNISVVVPKPRPN